MLLCRLDDVPDGGARGFDPRRAGHDTLFVVRRGDRLLAYADVCPHLGTPMAWRKDAYLNAAGDRIVCAAHGALFDVESGACTLGPCLGQSLTPIPLSIGADGSVRLAVAHPEEQIHDQETST